MTSILFEKCFTLHGREIYSNERKDYENVLNYIICTNKFLEELHTAAETTLTSTNEAGLIAYVNFAI